MRLSFPKARGPLRATATAAALALSAMTIAAPAGGSSGPTVAIIDLHYRPSPITVQVGQTITWVNEGFLNHSVTADSGEFDSGTIRGEKQYSMTFAKPGTFAYHCTFHPNMHGTVIVTGHAASSPVSEPPAAGPTHPPTSASGPAVSLKLKRHGRHTNILVSASPAGAEVLLELYSREHFAWIQVAHAALNAQGMATFTLKADLHRPARAVVLGGEGASSISPTRRT
jgi:plastocyanin